MKTQAEPIAGARDGTPAAEGAAATGALADQRARSARQRQLQEGADRGPQATQLQALQARLNVASARRPVAQRIPVPLVEGEDDGVYKDSKYSWMRMIFREDLGEQTFELLKTDGKRSGSLMIWEQETDQYRFSPDGHDFDDAKAPPHFMEEITGDARIDDETDDLHSYVGEYGVGYRPAEGKRATLEMSGFNACIGFVLECEGAAFCCHMVVRNEAPQDQDLLKGQVNALVARFEQYAGAKPSNCRLYFSRGNYPHGAPDWLAGLTPDGVETQILPINRDPVIGIPGQMEGKPTVMWRGNPIRY